MTSPPPPSSDPAAPAGRGGQDALWAWLRGLAVVRSGDDRWLTGVAGGVAARLGVDPVLVRAGFVLLAVFGGVGVPLYLAAWALLPATGGTIMAERAVRQRDGKSIALLVVVAVVVLGGTGGRWWWTVLPGAAVLYWLYRSRRGASVTAPGAVPPWTPPVVTPPATGPYSGSPPTPGAAASGSPLAAPPAPPLSAASPYGDPATAGAYGAPYGMGPGRTGAVSTPTGTWTPPRAQRRRAGVLGLLLAVGLGVAGAAVGSEVLDDLRATGPLPDRLGPVPFTLGCALAGVGLALLLIGLLGRRAGFTGLLAVGLTVATIGAASAPPFVFSTGTSDRTWVASQPRPPEGYVVGLGDGRLDLTGATPGQEFDVKVGLGDLTVVVPAGVTATIKPSLGLGDLAVVRDNGTRESLRPEPTLVVGDGRTAVTVRATLVAGDLTATQATAAGSTRPGGTG